MDVPVAMRDLTDLEGELEHRGFQVLSWCDALRHVRRAHRVRADAGFEEDMRSQRSAQPRPQVTDRLWACIIDVVAFCPAVRHLHDVACHGQPVMDAAVARLAREGTTEATVRAGNQARRPAEAFVVSLKAMHFLLRALQDAAYCTLLEVLGQNVGKKSSMADAVNSEKNPVRVVLDKHWPQYIPWFDRHRKIRNLFKQGLLTGWTFVPTTDGLRFSMPPIGESLATIEEGLRQSASLMGIIAEEAGRARDALAAPTST